MVSYILLSHYSFRLSGDCLTTELEQTVKGHLTPLTLLAGRLSNYKSF